MGLSQNERKAVHAQSPSQIFLVKQSINTSLQEKDSKLEFMLTSESDINVQNLMNLKMNVS